LRKYQIVLLGPDAQQHRERVLSALERRVNDLGDGIWDCIDVLEGASAADFDKTAPVFVIWFGSPDASNPAHLAALDALLASSKPTVPLVRDLENFKAQTPPQLHAVNGLPLDETLGTLDRVINTILEGLQLLRRRRRVFISYARVDSRAAAKQLFGSLAEHGFDVFLDTHSVPAASNFQHQLWHSMVDSDLVLLLDTNGVEASRWCRAEYERADALSIGVVRVLWPDRAINPLTDALLLSHSLQLVAADFRSGSASPNPNDELTEAAIARIGQSVEGFRARSIAARQANLVTTFQREAGSLGLSTSVQANSHIYVEKPDGRGGLKTVAVVPTIGVPISTNYHDAYLEYDADPTGMQEQLVLYNRQGFLPSWVDHLNWLNGNLPVKGIDVTEVPTWLSTP
jgi:hypothetical protein